MKKILYLVGILVIIVLLMLTPNEEKKNVLYGERSHVFKPSKNTQRLYLDKLGHFYPEQKISNAVLLENNASVKTFYKNNPEEFKAVAAGYKLNSTMFSDENFSALQDSIISRKVKNINAQIHNISNLYILIHGFRKPIVTKHSTTSSYIDNLIMKSTVTDQTETKNYFVEVYWDGIYDYFEPTKTNQQEETFKLFENEARTNAVRAGYELRKFIPELNATKITIMTHSLGARVALSCLINTYDDYVDELLQGRPTPAQDTVNICLIAPAIANRPFEEYYERSTPLDFEENDNYKLRILYNEEDFVLLKKWGFIDLGAEKYGDTSLGCNYDGAISKLKDMFGAKYPNSDIAFFQASAGPTHLVEHYVHDESFSLLLEGL